MTSVRTWIAVGDSFTAGTGDDADHGGWTRRTASALLRAGRIDEYRTHAEPGVLLDTVLRDQVPLVRGRASIVSAIAGANDLLGPRGDLTIVLDHIDELLDWALGRADIELTTTCPDFFARRSAGLRRLSSRIEQVNDHVDRRAGARLVVVDARSILADPSLWADDQIHANPQGHQRLAETAIALLDERLGNGR